MSSLERYRVSIPVNPFPPDGSPPSAFGSSPKGGAKEPAQKAYENRYLGGDTSLTCSAGTQTRIDTLVVELVRAQHEKAVRLLQENRAKLDELAQFLYERETITGEEFMNILRNP